MNALITFGCSWTKGKFCWYDPNILSHTEMSDEEIKSTLRQQHFKDLTEEYCFRTILSRRHNYVNINYAKGGSSNRRQFRHAEEYFNTDDYKKYNNVIVLWGITSTARMELWSNKEKKYTTYHLTKKQNLKWTMDHYDHDVVVKRLSTQIQHWDNYFKMIGVKNYWFDTFNHHNYTYDSPNMIMSHEKSRDLMSNLCIDMGHKPGMNEYHLSLWELDDDRIKFLRKKNLVNPTTHHPNRECHIKIADMLDKYVNFCYYK